MRPLSFQSNLESYKNLPQKHLNQFEYQTKSPIIQMARGAKSGGGGEKRNRTLRNSVMDG